MDTIEYKSARTLSKKKYYELEKMLSKEYNIEDVEKILSLLKNVLHFDPNISNYTEVTKENIMKRREKLKAEGISTYISSGAKAFYHNKKKNAPKSI
jgi:hypothetical protein